MCTKKLELQLSYFSNCEGKKLDDKISELIALKAGSTVYTVYVLFFYSTFKMFVCLPTK